MALCGNLRRADEVANGVILRSYAFSDHKTKKPDPLEPASFMVNDPAEVEAAFATHQAIAEGVFFTRDLTNEPANVLTTTEFADRLVAMKKLGLKVEVLDEPALEKLGMGSRRHRW